VFGVKTKIIQSTRSALIKLVKGKLSNDITIKHLMEYFGADEYGHQAKIEEADLGYGWIHYSFVRVTKPKNVLCIGSRHGFIAAVLAQACKDNGIGYVDFVDPGYGSEDRNHWTGEGYWKTKEGRECFKNFGLEKWINLHIMTTSEFAKKTKSRYDYIYIDGDHSYKGVSLDYKLLWPRLENYGFMAFHDVSITDPKPEGQYGIHKLWEKIGKKNAFVLPFEGSGLGVIQKITKQ